MRRGTSVLLATAWMARATQAGATEPARLEYRVESGVDGCPDAEALRASVASRLGYDPFRDDAERLVSARISRTSAALRGDIELHEEGRPVGARSLKAERCGDLAGAMALAIAMAIDPVHALAPAAPVATSPPPAPPTPTGAPSIDGTPPPPRAPAPSAPPASTPLVPRVHAGAGLAALGPAAAVTPLVVLGGGVRYGATAIDIEGRFLPPSSAKVEQGTVRTSMLGVTVLPCAYLEPLFFCAAITLAALQGEAADVDAPEKASTLFAQAGARVAAALRVHRRTTIEPFVDALATLSRTRINFRGREVWSTSPLGLEGGVRVAVHFP